MTSIGWVAYRLRCDDEIELWDPALAVRRTADRPDARCRCDWAVAGLDPRTEPTVTTHTPGHRKAQAQVLAGSAFDVCRIDVAGRQVQLIEKGEGTPLVILHGTGAGALILRPLLDRLDGVRVIAPDRPGQGLSEPIDIPRRYLRTTAVAWVDHLLDTLELKSIALAGHSMGGLWALWYALAHPERVGRLVLLAPPLLPGTRCPLPYRVMGTPVLFEAMQRLSKPSPKSALQFARLMGEGGTLAEHPDLVNLMVASGTDPVTVRTNVTEVRAIVAPLALVTPSGFRRPGVREDELSGLGVPTLLIWGDREPLGSVAVAQAIVDKIPEAELAVVSAGHGPWLGQPDRTASLMTGFVQRGHDGAATQPPQESE